MLTRSKPKPVPTTTLFDSTNYLSLRPSTNVALYLCGRYAAPNTPATAKRFKTITWICVCGQHPEANALDIETGDAIPSDVLTWVPAHVKHYGDKGRARLYSNLSAWPQVKLYVSKVSPVERSTVRYWIADPTGREHVVPGSSATQWFWGRTFDQSVALGDFT
jgi:hypothetical protein